MRHWVIYARITSYVFFPTPFLTISNILFASFDHCCHRTDILQELSTMTPSSLSRLEITNSELTFAKAELLLITVNTATQRVACRCTAKLFSTRGSFFNCSQSILVLTNFLWSPIHNFAHLLSKSYILSSRGPSTTPAGSILASPLHCRSSPEEDRLSHSLTT